MVLLLLIRILVHVGDHLSIGTDFISLISLDNDDWSGFYIDSIDENSCQMFSYINDEFYELLIESFNIDIDRIGIFGY